MHVFFDLDGTLTDPKEGIFACIRYALSRLNIVIESEINFESYIGPPLKHTFKTLCGDEEVAENALVFYRERFSTVGLFENRLYDGIHECLEQIVDKADSIHVVTSKPTIYSQRIIEHFNLAQYFKVVYGSNLDGSLSDKTELLHHVLEREDILPQNAVMIGDRKFDITGASNNGIESLGVLWGYGSEQELIDAGANGLCGHPNEIYLKLFA
jgi:phosphoglycolate phosphatase